MRSVINEVRLISGLALSGVADNSSSSGGLPVCEMPREEMKRPLIRGRGAGSMPLEASTSDTCAPVVGVLGTGDFSRSLTGRLVASGYQVVVGSRSPKRSLALFPEKAEVGVTPGVGLWMY